MDAEVLETSVKRGVKGEEGCGACGSVVGITEVV